MGRYIVNRNPRGKSRVIFHAQERPLRNPWSAKKWTARNLSADDVAARAIDIFIEDMAEWQGFGEQWRALPEQTREQIIKGWREMLANTIATEFKS